ncbi:MAG: DUF2318 domain-containing protein [Nitrospirae bacterium]|nr:DUF2318 domain-containing protein [Nitrospirota bacterium]
MFSIASSAFREGAEIGFLILLAVSFLKAEQRDNLLKPLFTGIALAVAFGAYAGYALLDPTGGYRNLWVFWGITIHGAIFFSSAFLWDTQLPAARNVSSILAAAFGFAIAFFEFGALASVAKGASLESGGSAPVFGAPLSLAAGAAIMLAPLKLVRKLDIRGVLSPATLLLVAGAFRLISGGMAEFEEQNLMIAMQRGMEVFVSGAVRNLREILLIPDHLYLSAPESGFLEYMGGDRMAMSATVAVIFFPPLRLLARLVAAPDPAVSGIKVGAERRMKIAGFRRDLTLAGAPMMAAFLMIFFLVHAANLSLNPLFDPAPVVVAPGDNEDFLRLPMTDKTGNLSDKKIRKYLYLYGDRKIIFLAIVKPDGTPAVALDECEICRPAAWNTKAIGYAQRGENLVCKYCVSPISVTSVGQPGGCNPIPFEAKFDAEYIYVPLKNLIDAWKAAQKIEKAGTHL